MDLEQEIGPDRIAYCMGKILELPEKKFLKGERKLIDTCPAEIN